MCTVVVVTETPVRRERRTFNEDIDNIDRVKKRAYLITPGVKFRF